MALTPKIYKMSTKAWVKLIVQSSWAMTAFENIQGKRAFEEAVVVEVTMVTMVGELVESQAEIGEGRPKGTHLVLCPINSFSSC